MTASVSRRRLVAGAAWAVPAVVVASAAPAFAASASCPILLNRQVSPAPGGGADIILNFDPSTITPGVTYQVSVSVNGCDLRAPQPVTISENQARFRLRGGANSVGCQAQVTYTVNPPGGTCGGSFFVTVGEAYPVTG